MRFYDYSLAPSPRKVRLFIAEKGLSIPTVEVDLRARAQLDAAFLAKNPGATVPVLELDDGTCLTESLAICHYLEQIHPEPNLLGADAKEQALVLMWTDIQTFEGYLGLQEALRNGHPAFKSRGARRPRGVRADSRARGARQAPRRSLFQQARDAARRERVHRGRALHLCRHRRLRLSRFCGACARRCDAARRPSRAARVARPDRCAAGDSALVLVAAPFPERAPRHDQRLAVMARDERLDAIVRANRRRAERRFGRPVADDGAVVHEQHAVAEARREAEIVQHDDDEPRVSRRCRAAYVRSVPMTSS